MKMKADSQSIERDPFTLEKLRTFVVRKYEECDSSLCSRLA